MKLPKGAKTIKPIRQEIGGWVKMEYDAKVMRLGLVWFRAKGGFGQRGDREDWVADVPSGCLSVSRWTGEGWKVGFTNYKSFDMAIRGETKRSISCFKDNLIELQQKAEAAKKAVVMLQRALRV